MNKAQITTYIQELPWKEIRLNANKYLPKLVLLILILLLVQTAAEITWKLVTPAEETSFKTTNFSTPQVNTPNISLNEVSQYHLFGDAKKQPIVQHKVIDAPETRLKLSLKGVFSTNSSNALAIISSSKGKDETYHLGDKVTGGAILHAVYADRVILKRNGRLETLRLPKPKVDSSALYKANTYYTSQQTKSVNARSGRQNQAQSQRLRQMRDTLLKDPSKIWQQVRINPVMENGKVKGYTLTHNDKGLMKALNIQGTDIITGVNGQSLSDPATLYGLMNSLSDQQSLELTIVRNGQEQSIQLSF